MDSPAAEAPDATGAAAPSDPAERGERTGESEGSKVAEGGPGDLPPVGDDAASAKETASKNPARQSFVGNGGPASRGRGRGGRGGRRGRGRYSVQRAPTRAPNPPTSAAVGTSACPQPSLPEIFWCDICRVECTSKDNLEMHENGKRHNKTALRLVEMNTRLKQLAEHESNNAVGTSVSVASQTEPVNGSQEEAIKQLEMVVQRADEHCAREKSVLESNSATAACTDNKVIAEPNQSVCRPIVPVKIELETDDQGGASAVAKRKKKAAGQSSKRLKGSEPVQGIPQLKEPPIMCTFCNVTCDTRAVFECHLVGKKHLSRFKQYDGGEAMYGPLGYFPQSHPHFYTHLGVPQVLFGFQSQMVTPQGPQPHHLYVAKDYSAYQQIYAGANEQVAASSVAQCEGSTHEGVGYGVQNLFPGNAVPEYQPVYPTWNCQLEANVPGQSSGNPQLT